MRWWAHEAGLTTEAQRRSLRTLRRQTYDLLDERGLIVKPVGPSAVVDVSPAGEVEPSPAEPAAAAAADGVGAWILRLDPTVWDLGRFVADGHREVSTWAVEDNARSAAMTHGQRVFLWAAATEPSSCRGSGVPGGSWALARRSRSQTATGRSRRQQPTRALRRCLDPVPSEPGRSATRRQRPASGRHRGPPGSVGEQSKLPHTGGSGRHARVGRVGPGSAPRRDGTGEATRAIQQPAPTSRRRWARPPVPGRWVRTCTAPGCRRCSCGSAASAPPPSASAPW